MRFFHPAIALIWASVFAPSCLFATTIVPFANLGEATTYSESVLLARAVETFETSENGSIYQDTRFESIESAKGVLLPGTQFTLRPLSRIRGDFKINITGDFKPEVGKTYLLFLYKQGAFWRPVMLSYYAFEQFSVGDDEFLVPVGGEGIETVIRPDGQAVEPLGVMLQDVFLQNLRAFATSPQQAWDGSIGRSLLKKEAFEAQDRSVPTGCDFTLGGNLCRWQDSAIPIYYDDTDNPAGWAGTFSTVLTALNDNYLGIDPTDAGSVDYDPDCGNGSAIEGNFLDFCDSDLNGPQSALIIFDDPCNEIPNLSGCSGTLAFGGSYSSSSTHIFDGLTWEDALYAFVVVNNGTPGCLTSLQFEQVITHELTHGYRMGHLNETTYPDQNMNPNCCHAINTKDEDCMNYAYPPPAPVELLSFEARLHGEKQVKLQWVTESEKDNAYFSIQRSANGAAFGEIKQIESSGSNQGGVYEWLDSRPLSGLNYYQLSQTDFDGSVEHLGIKAVTVGKEGNILSVHPNPMEGNNLVYSIEFPTDFEGTLEVLGTDGRVVSAAFLTLEKGVQHLQLPLGEIPSGVYLLRLFNGQESWAARFLKQ